MSETSSASQSIFSGSWNDASEEDVSYRRLSILSVLAFFFGLASFLIFFSLWFCFVGVLGVLLSLSAILLINRSENSLSGLFFAQTGLACSIISLVAISILWPTYQYGVRLEADRFFRLWFQAVRDDNIPHAKELVEPYWQRPSIDNPEKWWTNQYENKFAHRDIHQYVENKLLRTMLAFGDRATVSYYKTLSVTTDSDKDVVVTVYAVSFPTAEAKNGERKTETFFIKMAGERRFPGGDIKSAGWQLAKLPEFYIPDEFKSSATKPGRFMP